MMPVPRKGCQQIPLSRPKRSLSGSWTNRQISNQSNPQRRRSFGATQRVRHDPAMGAHPKRLRPALPTPRPVHQRRARTRLPRQPRVGHPRPQRRLRARLTPHLAPTLRMNGSRSGPIHTVLIAPLRVTASPPLIVGRWNQPQLRLSHRGRLSRRMIRSRVRRLQRRHNPAMGSCRQPRPRLANEEPSIMNLIRRVDERRGKEAPCSLQSSTGRARPHGNIAVTRINRNRVQISPTGIRRGLNQHRGPRLRRERCRLMRLCA